MCLYVAVVPDVNVDLSILGTLDAAPVKSFPLTFVIYFLNAKSNSLVSGVLSINIIGCVFCTVGFAYNVTFVFECVVPFAYPAAFSLAFVIK